MRSANSTIASTASTITTVTMAPGGARSDAFTSIWRNSSFVLPLYFKIAGKSHPTAAPARPTSGSSGPP